MPLTPGPVAELRPPSLGSPKPRFGEDRGRVVIGDDFDDPLPEMKPLQFPT